jgi:dephospho-CoA kinase
MLRIGITGGIGSGKSTVAKVFETLGIPVYYADDAAKRILQENNSLKKEIASHFGEAIFIEGKLDKKLLAELVFNDEEKLTLLNSLVHPLTIEDAESWFTKQTSLYAIKEAALLFESGATANLDYVIGVNSPRALRIKRVMDRNQLSKEEVEQRISKQLQEDIKMKLCDFVITNDEQELIIPQVLDLDTKLKALALKKH